MLLVKTYLDKSVIDGLGVFAGEYIRKGTKVWRFVEGFDRIWSPREFAKLPKQARDYIGRYGYRVDGEILLTCDHDHHMNHSPDSNTYWRNGHIVARRDIAKGEELTNDYRLLDAAFCAAFLANKKPIRRKNGARAR
jgi:SET domain-containing protein